MMHLLLPITLMLAGGGFRDDNRDGAKVETDVSADDRDAIHQTIAATRAAAARLLEDALSLKGRGQDSIEVKVFRLESEYDDHRRATRDRQTQDYGLAFYNPSSRQITMTWKDGDPGAAAALRGQTARQVLLRYAKEPPTWFEEGFVAYFSGFEFDPYGDKISSLDPERLDEARDAIERSLLCPLDVLMELETIDFFGYAGSSTKSYATNVLIAESWGLLFHLFDAGSDQDAAFLEILEGRLRASRYSKSKLKKELPRLDHRWRLTMDDVGLQEEAAVIRAAWAALKDGDTASARMKASQILGRDEQHRSARRVLAHTCLAEQDFDSAITAFDWLLETTADDVDALLGRSTAYLGLARTEQREGALEQALASGERAAQLAPPAERHIALVLCADAAEAGGDVRGALRFVRDAQKQDGLTEATRTALHERERELVRRLSDGGHP